MDNNSINIDYNKYYSETISNSQFSDIKERTNIEDTLQSLAIAGGVVGLGTYTYNQAKKNNKVLEMVENLPGARLLSDRLSQSSSQIAANSLTNSPQPLSRSLHSMLLAAEEASPLHIAKTLGLSSFQTLFVEIVDQEKQTIKIGSDSIKAFSEYYRNLVLNASGYVLTRKDIQNGFLLEGDKLFLANRDGTKGREIAGYARIISTNTTIGHQDSPNRTFQKFANIQGVDVHVSQFKKEPLAIVAGTNKAQVMQDWTRAQARFSTEIGFKVLDNPLGFIEEMFGNLGVNTQESKLFNNKFVSTFKKHINLGLGADGVYNKGNREAMKIMAKNLGIKAIGAYTSYVSVNHFLEKITGEDNPWHNGIGAGITDMYAKMRIGLAEIWSDNFQAIREEQEEAAPESTSLLTLAAFPLGGAMLGANIAYFKRMRDIASKGFDEGAKINTEIKKFDGTIGKILDKVKMNPEGTTLARYGKLGALAGAALTLPFLPGALVGRSSEELRAEYSGTSDVAVRRGRFWLFGGNPYEGEQIKYHRKSLARELITDARNKTLYEDGDQQRDMDPLASPFEYFKNPYAFEEAHQHDMPYAVWGMDVTYGSFMGKIFQGTIGQLIKPTIVNPEIAKQVEEEKRLNPSVAPMTFDEISQLEGYDNTAYSINVKMKDGQLDPDIYYHHTDSEGVEHKIRVAEKSDIKARDTDKIEFKVKESKKDISMQKDGMMLSQSSATVDPTKEAMVGAYAAFSDFTGLKGFTSSLALEALGLDPTNQTAPKLAVSGSANTLVGRYQSMQLGDAMGCFTKGTYVLWEDGYLPIEKVQVGYRLLSKNGYLRVVSKTYSKEVNEEIVKTTIEDGTIIYSTINHVFPGYNKDTNSLEEKAIVLWRVGDKLIQQVPLEEPQKLSIVSQELVWYKGTVYDLEMSEGPSRPSTVNTNYYTVQDILCHNSGEFIRRLLPQSADTRREEVNPMRNTIGDSMCLLEDTDVLLWDRTTVKAKDLKVGDNVLSDDGSCQQVVAVSTMEAKEWYDISLYGNNCYTYKLSDNHPVLVKDKGYVMAKDLLVNDLIAYPRTKYLEESTIIDLLPLQLKYMKVSNNFKYDNTYIYSSNGKIKRFWYSEDFFFILGVYAAEGSRTSSKRISGVSFAGNATYEKWLERLSRILTKYEVCYREARYLEDNKLQVIVSTQLLSSILINTCPGHAREKRFEFDSLPFMSKGDVKALLNGLIDGDGYYIKTAENRYKLGLHTTSKQLAYQTYELICSLYGIRPSITEGKIKTELAYHTTVNGWEDSSTIARDFGYTLHTKHETKVKYTRKNYIADVDYVYTRIKKIHKYTEDVKVYAQEVTGNHTFCLPMMATHNTWLPKDPTFRDFGAGNYFEATPDIGYTMLPGSRGFDALHPELRGIDPNNYSDAWKYRILQNVARGSKEHYAYRDKLIKEVDTLSDYDKDIFFTAYEQDMARNEEKRFFEYRTEEDKTKMNILQLAQNTIWESVSHLESPTEPLTPFRPMAKFLHQRTAIEDYRRTQLAGSDAAIWTKPIDHFINPTINRHIQLFDEFYKPRDVKEKEAIDTYFDNLKLVKSNKDRPYDARNTVVSAIYSGMRNSEDMEAFKRALPDNQKAYVESFAAEKDEKKRAEILEMLPSNIGRVYKSIWTNIDEYDNAIDTGQDPNKRLRELYLRETEAIKKETGLTLTREEIEGINKASYKIRDKEERENFIAEEKAAKIRAKAAQQEAHAYIDQTTGIPLPNWVGWDKRLTIDDIKLKTLSIGQEDITRFGYWNKEKQRNDRIVALDNDTQTVNRLKDIKKELRENQDNKHLLKRRLKEQGYEVHDIETSPGAGSVNINV